jgi:hypothetical protein
MASHDLEDLITVVDGRPQLFEELRLAAEDVRSFIAKETGLLLETPQFIDAIPGYLLPDAASQGRVPLVVERLKEIAGL